jgi:hypothetical protein
MLIKSIVFVLVVAGLAVVSIRAEFRGTRTDDRSDYVKLEVEGTLLHQGPAYYVQTHDANFPDQKLLVRLERSEDKNRALDRHLEQLEGQSVIARGFLDCRRVGQEAAVIYLYLSSADQIVGREPR